MDTVPVNGLENPWYSARGPGYVLEKHIYILSRQTVGQRYIHGGGLGDYIVNTGMDPHTAIYFYNNRILIQC